MIEYRMNLKTYINIQELLKHNQYTREENRAFGLKYQSLAKIDKLRLWSIRESYRLASPTLGDRFTDYEYRVSLLLGILSLVLGFLSALGLLSYSGDQPVNVIYFVVITVFIPIVTMLLSIISMFKASSMTNLFIHISPSYWIEKLLSYLPKQTQNDISDIDIAPQVLNWLIIKRAQGMALLFAIGILVGLFMVISTRDIAFGWSSTLDISTSAFYEFLYSMAFAWRDTFDWAVPSMDLIDKSRYLRLGGSLNDTMVANASILGHWWGFLLFSTLFYAIFLRFLLWLWAKYRYDKAIKDSIMEFSGVKELLLEMNNPIVSTISQKQEEIFIQGSDDYARSRIGLSSSYDMVLGFSMSKDEISLLNDSLSIQTSTIHTVGGNNSIKEDLQIINKSKGYILLYIKAWEAPTMEMIDFIIDLSQYSSVTKVDMAPIGLTKNNYKYKQSEFSIWQREMKKINQDKVWICKI